MIRKKVIGAALVLVILGAGGYLVVKHTAAGSNNPATVVQTPAQKPTVPTPAWYEAHRDALQIDNRRCAQEGTNMPHGLCANVAIADQYVSNKNALNALDQASSQAGTNP